MNSPASVSAMRPDTSIGDNFPLPTRLQTILDAEYPRFSDSEMLRRRKAIEDLIADADLDHLVYCGANRVGTIVQWLSQWPVTQEAIGVLTPGLPDALFVQHVKHVPLARRLADKANVAWGGSSTVRTAVDELDRRGAKAGRVGLIGTISHHRYSALAGRYGSIRTLNAGYTRLRQVKSAEELDWLRIGATFSDRGMAGLCNGLRPSLTERQLGDLIERTYVGEGGTNWIHYIGTTPMSEPRVGVPCQFPSTRKIRTGDIVFAEISASFWDHTGQVLRSFAVGAEPTPLYRSLHAVADAAFDAVAAVLKAGATPQQVVDAAAIIEDSGYTVIDDLLHGYGGGYLQPILGSRSRPAGPIPEEPFRAGQTVVIQPNVVTLDGRAGVQTGEMVLITQTGIERMHAFPRGFAAV